MTLNKGLDEEGTRILAVAREKKENKRQLEEKMTKKGSVMSEVVGQQYEPHQNNEEKFKPKEGTGNA